MTKLNIMIEKPRGSILQDMHVEYTERLGDAHKSFIIDARMTLEELIYLLFVAGADEQQFNEWKGKGNDGE